MHYSPCFITYFLCCTECLPACLPVCFFFKDVSLLVMIGYTPTKEYKAEYMTCLTGSVGENLNAHAHTHTQSASAGSRACNHLSNLEGEFFRARHDRYLPICLPESTSNKSREQETRQRRQVVGRSAAPPPRLMSLKALISV